MANSKERPAMKVKFDLRMTISFVLMGLALWQNIVDLACLVALGVVLNELLEIRKLLAAALEKGQP